MTITRINIRLYQILKGLPGVTDEDAQAASDVEEMTGLDKRLDGLEGRIGKLETQMMILISLTLLIVALLLNLTVRGT
jgi:hypothetical protein